MQGQCTAWNDSNQIQARDPIIIQIVEVIHNKSIVKGK